MSLPRPKPCLFCGGKLQPCSQTRHEVNTNGYTTIDVQIYICTKCGRENKIPEYRTTFVAPGNLEDGPHLIDEIHDHPDS